MTRTESQYMVKRVDFFAEQVKQRVWDSFEDFDQQVNAHIYGNPEYMFSGDFADLAEIADIVFEDKMEFSELLFDLSRNITLASVAALYHQWERDIRQFLERELWHYAEDPDTVWTQSTENILHWLEVHGWPIQRYKWFPIMDACRLVVNVYKHGKGRSLNELKNKYPHYLDLIEDVVSDEGKQVLPYIDHDHLHVTEERFDEFVEAIRQFWSTFPEQIYLK